MCASVADDNQIYLWDLQNGDVCANFEQEVLPEAKMTCHLAATGNMNSNENYLFCAAKQLKVKFIHSNLVQLNLFQYFSSRSGI